MGRTPKKISPELSVTLKILGGNISELLKKQNLTQADLAIKAKISASTMNGIVTQRNRDIRISTLLAIAQVLKVPILSLFQNSDLKLSQSDQVRLLKASEDISLLVRKIKSEN